ncbi:unnamed protein product [Macrosiphum euphorbiae]|uniref:Uncharacterized protein n=1 Tax=Macrosiphum euphorbiae TaxID=13131 RepID=A0AAV0WHS9_9HEMI|nr:unnamed protein product [Macrosiphum euphorbiae]
MDGESTNDVIVVGEDATTEFSTIPLMMEFEERETVETVNPVPVNQEPVEMEQEPQQEPFVESAVPPAVNTVATTVTAIRLGSGADDNPTTAAGDVEEENMDRRARSTRSRGRRSRRGRSRSRRSRRRRSRRGRSRSDDGDFYVQIADDDISAAPAGSSRGSQKTARGGRRAKNLAITSRRGGKATQSSQARDNAIRGTRGGRKSARGSRRGRKNTECVTARTMWSERLRPISLNRNKK